MKEALIYFLAITAAELITAIGEPVWGIFGHIIVLIAVILHSALTSRQPHQQLLLSLALVPLVRIISLSMPLANIPQIWWYPIIYVPLLAAAFVVLRILGYKLDQIGLNFKRIRIQLAVALTGPVFGIMEYYILKPEPMVVKFSWQGIWPLALVLLVSTGFVEEFIFRGVMQQTALEAFGWRGLVYVGLLFAFLHIGFLSWIDVVFVFLVALFFSWIVKKTGSLLGVTLSHGITNIMLYLIVPFLLG